MFHVKHFDRVNHVQNFFENVSRETIASFDLAETIASPGVPKWN